MLQILLNGNLVSQQQIVCDAGEISHDLLPGHLREGQNVLAFVIDGGKYTLERLLLEGSLGAGKVPSYSFGVEPAVFDFLGRGGIVGLDLLFGQDTNRKIATLFVNGQPLYLETTDDSAHFDITRYIVPGRNTIRIVAETPFSMAGLDVVAL